MMTGGLLVEVGEVLHVQAWPLKDFVDERECADVVDVKEGVEEEQVAFAKVNC